ncbi:MAG: hypothetical protein IE933_14500, partial [Sphingomonadales bacterium]|nr:hypothetical protein [Sphingomonadales bacterium]
VTGDQTFQTATVTYEIVSQASGSPPPVTNPSAQNFGSGTVIKYTEATDMLLFTAPGGTPSAQVAQGAFTTPTSGVKQWFVGSPTAPTDVITLFDPTRLYSFVGTWAHIENGVATYRLAATGIPTKAGDFPSGTVSYTIAMGGSARVGGTSYPIDAARSSGTLTINFATRTGTLAINIVSTGGNSLGQLNGTIALPASGNGFTGTVNFSGVSGNLSGAFFGPQAAEASFAVALSDGNQNSYVGLGGG